MPLRVLVVDDSRFFQRRLTEILNADPGIEVVDTAVNGLEAIAKVRASKPDVVTMDVEMPVMDGITAVREIMAKTPTPVLMFSSLTHEGARATLDALEAGAVDFLPKQLNAVAGDRAEMVRQLRERVRILGRKARRIDMPAIRAAGPAAPVRGRGAVSLKRYGLVAIGTSTGGPVALQKILTELPGDFPLPLLLIQHMPAGFTTAFAARLDQLCAISVKEAGDGDELAPGRALLSPGGKQTTIARNAHGMVVRVEPGDPKRRYKPSVDLSLSSAAETLGGRVLAVILTGMGADGREGVRALKTKGASVWAQDEASCVVYGMPMAVITAGLADRILPLGEIGARLGQGH